MPLSILNEARPESEARRQGGEFPDSNEREFNT